MSIQPPPRRTRAVRLSYLSLTTVGLLALLAVTPARSAPTGSGQSAPTTILTAPAAPAPAAAPAAPAAGTAPVLNAQGQRVCSNVYFETDIRQALSDVATQLGVTIIADDTVTGTVTVELKNATLDQALELLLLRGGYLSEEVTPGVYLVTSLDPTSPNFRKIAKTETVALNYIEPKDLQGLLPDMYSKFAHFDQLGNRVVVCAPPQLLAEIVAQIHSLDVPPVQVMIEALVVETDSDALRRLELTSQTTHFGLDTANGIVTYTGGSGVGSTTGTSSTGQAASLLSSLLWLVTKNQAQIKANPRVVAQAGREAKVGVAVEQWFELLSGQIGYQYSTLQSVTAAVTLTITPRVALADKQITCTIAPSVGDVTGTGANNLPIITTRSATTTVRVADGQIIAVGGLSQEVTREIRRRIPLLSDLPLVGALFRSHDLEKDRQELTIFVVPHILDAEGRFQGPLLLDRLQRQTPPSPPTPASPEGPR